MESSSQGSVNSLGQALEHAVLKDNRSLISCIDQQIDLLENLEVVWMGRPKAVSALPHRSVLTGRADTGGLPVGPSSNDVLSKRRDSLPAKDAGGLSMPMNPNRPYADDEADCGPPMLPNTPFPAHMLLKSSRDPGAQAPSAAPSAAVPTPISSLGIKVAPGQKSQLGEFPPVFLSPIPPCYLAAQSKESHDEGFLASLGSPETTQRGGRLASAAISGEWTDEPDCPSGSGAGILSSSLKEGGMAHNPRSRLGHAFGTSPEPISDPEPVGASSTSYGLGSSAGQASAPAPTRSNGTAAASPSPIRPQHPFLSRPPVVSPPSAAPPPFDMPFSNPADPFVLVAGGMSIAAAASSKRQNQKWGTLRLVAGTAMIPHIDKVEKGGEDAACISERALGAIGVADGVSGWAEEGIDPADYSRTLIRFTADALEASQHPHGADPREVIRYAHQSTVLAGSSTICVAVMKPNSKMHVANLGDSGVRVIRDGKIVFASVAQQHMFNMPFQLSHPSIIESPDDADCADVSLVDVQPGDVVVLATDGLYDNVFDQEIAQICVDALKTRRAAAMLVGVGGDAPPSPKAVALAAALREKAQNAQPTAADAEYVAMSIARVAHSYALNTHQKTPWSVSACETGMPWARFFVKGGGKMDDVTVVIGFVVDEDKL